MYLRSLEIQGFKSFPDKITLNFDKGITAIVGPNGSGKSNIGDAMRWVMGEQSSKALRGENMSGIIFHGTQTRAKSPFAQVTISIDNEDRSLDFDNDLVSVSRKLYRNGDSEYIINGNGVRLKDIVELFMDTGLGKDGYSIIGQGRIADIVNGKSNERREIFEEAAGISKFRFKKEEAERKLAAAEENILRLNDILGELEDRIGPLKNQAEKAEKYLVLSEEKKKIEVSLWVHMLDKYIVDLNGFDEKISAMKSQYEALSEELSQVENDIDESFAKSAQKSEEVDRIKEKIHQTELENSQGFADISIFENDISHLEESILQIKEQIEQSKNSKKYLEEELEKRKAELENLKKTKQESLNKISEKEDEFNKLIFLCEESDKTLSDTANAVNEIYLKKTEANFRLENAKNNLSESGINLEEAQNYKTALEEESKSVESDLAETNKAYSNACGQMEEFQNKLNGLNKLYSAKSEKLENCKSEFSKTDILLREISQKIKILQDLENSMEGFGFSVKFIMKSASIGRLNGVCGSVAGLINVKNEFTVAIETAIGGALQNIIVENEESAKRCMRLLKDEKKGRATFLPITSVKGYRMDSSLLEKENGFCAIGSDIIDCDEKYRGIVNYLLGRICIAEDIDSAAVIAKKYGYKFRIVTLDGQVINSGGSFTGGSVSKNAGILSRKNEISELEEKQVKLEKNHKELLEKKTKLESEVYSLNSNAEQIKEDISSIKNDCIRFEMELGRLKNFSGEHQKKVEENNALIDKFILKIKSSEEEISKAQKDIENYNKKIADMEEELANGKSAQSDFKIQREKLSEELSKMKIKSAEISKDAEACRLSCEQLTESIFGSDNNSDKLNSDIIENQNKIKEKQESIKKIKDSLSGADEKITELKNQAAKAQREHLEFDNAANKMRNSQKIKIDEKENLSGQLTRTEERKNNLVAEFDKLAGKLWDEYELTRSAASEQAEKIENITEFNSRLAVLKNKIKALGSVNTDSIEEYKEVSGRYDFMNGQLEDVKKSKAELMDLIDDLTSNMKSMFLQTFDSINGHFKKIFQELFGGGKGELSLTDSENVLECGIEINVQPPGKVITNLMSLSGGEQAMVAAAIYFAILTHSPSPFCLLDEIEAALDDVNVTRYARYLHRLTDKTQFIAITHRRGTMEEADVLYGVTMQEKGISKLLRMKAEDTDNMKLD